MNKKTIQSVLKLPDYLRLQAASANYAKAMEIHQKHYDHTRQVVWDDQAKAEEYRIAWKAWQEELQAAQENILNK